MRRENAFIDLREKNLKRQRDGQQDPRLFACGKTQAQNQSIDQNVHRYEGYETRLTLRPPSKFFDGEHDEQPGPASDDHRPNLSCMLQVRKDFNRRCGKHYPGCEMLERAGHQRVGPPPRRNRSAEYGHSRGDQSYEECFKHVPILGTASAIAVLAVFCHRQHHPECSSLRLPISYPLG